MKLNRVTLVENKTTVFEEDIDFSSQEFDPLFLRGINNCHVRLEATQYEDLLRLKLHIEAIAVAVCAYTLEDVELPLKIDEELDFTDNPDDEDCYYSEDVIIDIDEYVLGIILSYIPVKVIKKGAKPPKDGEKYRVLTEDELEEEKKNKVDSRWAKLDDLEF